VSDLPRLIYKIEASDIWVAAQRLQRYAGSSDDLRDGFIHFSTAKQARATAAKYFNSRPDLIVSAIETSKLGEALKWETSHGGALFPHLYAALDMTHVAWTKPLPLAADGVHAFPEEMV
jgi:uncharacterized protein (DUF952 family)